MRAAAVRRKLFLPMARPLVRCARATLFRHSGQHRHPVGSLEERALLESLGDEYSAYCRRTYRLIPGVY